MFERVASRARPLVWLVDDSPTETAISMRSLGDGFDFECFDEATSAVERLTSGNQQPDLLLLDWVMPGMQGDEVCRFLRSHPRTKELPIIMVTASRVETGDVVVGLTSGADDYVARPFAPEELRARVNTALRMKQNKDLALRERQRVSAVNELGRGLLRAGDQPQALLDELVTHLVQRLCDGASVTMLPGPIDEITVPRHRADATGGALQSIARVADPVVYSFQTAEDARAALPPTYASYIDRFGLSGLAILPLPVHSPVQGIVTITRDGPSTPFEPADIATIETCIEYTALSLQNALRLENERSARAQMNAVFANLPMGIVASDETGKLVLVNTAAAALVPGLASAPDLRSIYQLATWQTADGVAIPQSEWILDHVFDAAHSTSVEMTMIKPGSTDQRTLLVTGAPLRTALNELAGSVVVLQDVSAERAFASERERVSRFQQDMLNIVGHDLRNPLGAVLVGTELLTMQVGSDPKAGQLVKRIASSAHRMTKIVEQLLDVTRARLGSGIPLARRDVRLLPIVQGVVDELALAHAKVKFELQAGPDVIGRWDPDRLGQVLSNLCSNAVQYGLPGGPITVSTSSTETHAVIEVKNPIRDKPIPPELQATLFAPYQRGRGSERLSSGIGLGLYIVYEIVRAHGGTITVQSDADGTCFHIELPLLRPA